MLGTEARERYTLEYVKPVTFQHYNIGRVVFKVQGLDPMVTP